VTDNPVPADVIKRSLNGMLVPGRRYPGQLPDELTPWHCYVADSGHSILVVLGTPETLPDGPQIEDYLVPAPVKTVLRHGWKQHRGYITADLPYDPDWGLLGEEGDSEYADDPTEAPGPQMTMFSVGQPYNRAISPAQWQAVDGVGQLTLRGEGAEFLLPIGSPTPTEVAGFRGNAEFALVPSYRVLALVYRFLDPTTRKGLPWSDTTWQDHPLPGGERAEVPGQPGTGFPIHLILIDAHTGIVVAMRAAQVPADFADGLRAAVQRQRQHPYDQNLAARAINDLYDRYTTEKLLSVAEHRFEALRDGT
jgi:hypothetical protein